MSLLNELIQSMDAVRIVVIAVPTILMLLPCLFPRKFKF